MVLKIKAMKQQKKECKRCKEDMPVTHGNQKYHPYCAQEQQIERSELQALAKRLSKDPYCLNEKLLAYHYNRDGEGFEYDPDEMEKFGFNFSLYRGETIKDNLRVFIVTKHGFSLLINKKIKIWKL